MINFKSMTLWCVSIVRNVVYFNNGFWNVAKIP